MSDIKENIAKNLKFFRKERRVTQKKLGEVLGVENNTISSWESGTNSIDASSLMEICDYLNVSLDDMFGRVNKTSSILKLPEVEQKLIESWRKLDDSDQARIIERIDTMLEISATREEYEDKVKRA